MRQATAPFAEARAFLSALECDLGKRDIPLLLVDGRAMCDRQGAARSDGDARCAACGQTRTVIEKSRGKVVRRALQDIAILNYLSRLHFTSVAVHELCHAWLFFSGFWQLPVRVEEGLCVFMEYVYLKDVAERWTQAHTGEREEALFLIRLIEGNQDKDYGDGFRTAREAVQRYGLRRTLLSLRENRYWPGSVLWRDNVTLFFRRFLPR